MNIHDDPDYDVARFSFPTVGVVLDGADFAARVENCSGCIAAYPAVLN